MLERDALGAGGCTGDSSLIADAVPVAGETDKVADLTRFATLTELGRGEITG